MVLIGGPPETIEETYTILQDNRLAGLLRLDILTIFVMPFYYPLFYSLFTALRKNDNHLSALSMILAFAGLTLFLAAPSVFSYVHLGDKFAAASSEQQRNLLIAAGESVYAADIWHGSGPRVGGLLLQTGALLISVAMFRSALFTRATAIVGIVTHGLDLIHIIIGFFSVAAGNAIMFIAGPLYLIWFPMVGAGLFKIKPSEE